MLKPLKIVLGNRTPCSRGGISAALRASCVLIVRSVCRIWASCQVGILLFDSLKGQSGEPWPCQRFKAGVELGLFCWKTVKESQGWLSSVNARVQFPSTGETTSEKLWCLILKDGVCMTQTSCTYTTNGNCKLYLFDPDFLKNSQWQSADAQLLGCQWKVLKWQQYPAFSLCVCVMLEMMSCRFQVASPWQSTKEKFHAVERRWEILLVTCSLILLDPVWQRKWIH